MWLGDEAEILYPRKTKWYALFVLCMIFAVGGYWLIGLPAAPVNRFWGYFIVAFFTVGALLALMILVPGSSFLRITYDGIMLRHVWRSFQYSWAEIDCFGVAEFTTDHAGLRQRHRMVGFNFAEKSQHRAASRRLASLNERLCGFQAALPDNYGWDCAELAEHLNQLLEKYEKS